MKLRSVVLAAFLSVLGVTWCSLAPAAESPSGQQIAAMINTAKSGATVRLPAGRFSTGDITVPAGVTVTGAGYNKTVLDAAGFDNGLLLKNAKSGVSDLAVENAASAGIAVTNASDVRMQRVSLFSCGIGVLLDHASGVRLENAIAANNRTGIVMLHSAKSAVVNCTAANNGNLSLSLGGNTDCAVFNNLLTGSQVGVFAGKDNKNLALDYNLYTALYVGGETGDPTRESLPAWRDASGYDAHSVEIKAAFADAKAFDFHPVSVLPWSPVRATTSDWGIKELAGYAAPATDIENKKRIGDIDLGAFETSFPAPRPADGKFTIQGTAGNTSAGVYDASGKQELLLFQNLPLRPGIYEFWLPAGSKLSPGSYEIRTAQSAVGLHYWGLIGNGDPSGGVPNDKDNAAGVDPTLVIFDRDDHPLLFQNGAEDYSQARSFDTEFKLARWRVTGGGGARAATADDANRLFYMVPVSGEAKDGISLFAVDAESGKSVAIENGSFRKVIKDVFSSDVRGMAFLNGKIYVADTKQNKIFSASTNDLNFNASFDLAAPAYPAADTKNQLLWVLSGEKVLALDSATGAVKYTAQPVEKPVSLAANNGRLAIASGSMRRVYVFDTTDPANLKLLHVVGREWKPGETGFGVLQPDRLREVGPVAINSKGEVAVLADNMRFFGADGALKRSHFSFWGQHTPSGQLTGPDGKVALNFSGMNATHTIALDAATHSWRPGFQLSRADEGGTLVAFFTEAGQNFGIYDAKTANNEHSTFEIANFTGGPSRTVVRFAFDDKTGGETITTDGNADGKIDEKDAAKPLTAPDGKAVTGLRFMQDGRLIAGGVIIPRHGVDASGAPQWDWSKYAPNKLGVIPAAGQGNFNGDFLPDGGWVSATNIGKGRGFGGGFNTIQAVDAAGEPLWTWPIDYHSTTGASRSLRVLPGVLIATATEELDTVFLTPDGLPLGVAGPGPTFNWEGFWHDQDWSIRTFVEGGKRYMVLGDYTRHAYHLMEIEGVDAVQRSKAAFSVDAAKATQIAALPVADRIDSPAPPTPTVLVKKLAAPLNIDGDLEKWRRLGIAPQIAVSPAGVRPDDASALVRVAYEGNNLYFQVLKFDDVVTMHQPLSKHYKQDSTELAIFGGFMGGYKFSVTHTTDEGDILYREQFLMKKELNLDAAKAPRVIKVLPNAQGVEERKLLENSYGVDLSNSKVIVTEFKIPLDYAWDGKPPMEMKSGAGFWLGLFIDDNDIPGLDDQKAYPWPATFAAFGNPDQGAWAILE